MKTLFLTLAAFLASFELGAAPVGPTISTTFPPPEDARKPDRTLPAQPEGPAVSIAYNFNGRFLASADDNKVRLWESRPGERGTGELIRSFEGAPERIVSIVLSPEDKTATAATLSGVVYTWEFATGKLLGSTLENAVSHPGTVVLRPGAKTHLARYRENVVYTEDYAERVVLNTFENPGAVVAIAAFSPDGKILVAGTPLNDVRAWDVETNNLVHTGRSSQVINTVAASATHVAAGCSDGILQLWRIGDREVLRELRAPGDTVTAIAFSPKGDQIAAAGTDHTIKVWDVESGALLCSQVGHSDTVLAIAFSPNGQKMASSSADGTLRYWTVPLPPLPTGVRDGITAALPQGAAAKPKKPRKLLVFWRADSILHKVGVPAANTAIEQMGKKTGAFETHFTRDYEALEPKILAGYDALVLNSTAHLALPEAAKKALLGYAKGGGGIVGIHAAIDTFKEWPEGAAIIGATFGGHPWGPNGTWSIKLEEPQHPLLRAWKGKNFKLQDEVYELAAPYSRNDRKVLLSLDFSDAATAGVKPLFRKDNDHAFSWIKRFGEGRVFFCMIGHRAEPFTNPAVLEYYLDGIQYALGDLEADASPSRAQ